MKLIKKINLTFIFVEREKKISVFVQNIIDKQTLILNELK